MEPSKRHLYNQYTLPGPSSIENCTIDQRRHCISANNLSSPKDVCNGGVPLYMAALFASKHDQCVCVVVDFRVTLLAMERERSLV